MKRGPVKRAEPRRPPPPSVRPARRADRSAIGALWTEADRMHAALHPRYFRGDGSFDPRLADALDRPSDDRALLIAERDGRTLGFVFVELLEPARHGRALGARRGHIDALVVAPGVRRAGIGRRLVEAATEWVRSRRADELLLTVWAGNEAAERFYERLGLQRVSHVLRLPLRR